MLSVGVFSLGYDTPKGPALSSTMAARQSVTYVLVVAAGPFVLLASRWALLRKYRSVPKSSCFSKPCENVSGDVGQLWLSFDLRYERSSSSSSQCLDHIAASRKSRRKSGEVTSRMLRRLSFVSTVPMSISTLV